MAQEERKLNIGLIVGGVVAFLAVLGFFLTWLLFMHTEVAEPGQELVIVDKPYFFGHEGVRAETVKEGRVLLFRTSTVVPVRTQMMSDVEAATAVDKEVTDALQKLVVDAKLPLRILGVSLGRAQPNENVLAQMNETAAQQQRKKTLIEAEAAEIQRKKEQIAKADADNAYRNSIGLSPEQFIQLEQIKRYSEACAKSTCIIGSVPVVVGGK